MALSIARRFKARRVFLTDMSYFLHYSNISGNYVDSREKLRSKIIACYHVIEKGLSMPNRRLGFGKDVLKTLIALVNIFVEKYGKEDEQLLFALQVIKAYDTLHKSESYSLDGELQTKINAVLAIREVDPINEFSFTKGEFFDKIDKPFDEF